MSTDRIRTRLYTDDQAQEILNQAMGLHEQGVSRQGLAQMATTLGISAEELSQAEELVATQADHELYQTERRIALKTHAITYLLAGLLILLISLSFAIMLSQYDYLYGSSLKFIVPGLIALFLWGVALAIHAWRYSATRYGPTYERKFARWRSKRQDRLARRRRRAG